MKSKIIAAALLVSIIAAFAQVAGWEPHNQDQWFKGKVAITDSLIVDGGVRWNKTAIGDTLNVTLGMKIPVKSSAPSPVPAEGSLYYNSTDELLYSSDGSAWNSVGAGTLAGDVTGPTSATVVGNDSHTHQTESIAGDVTGTLAATVVGNDSHTHAGANLTGTPSGELGGTFGSITVDNDGHEHTGASISAINNADWSGTDLTVANGGSGASTLTSGGVLLGSGTGAITAMAVLANSAMIVGDGTTDPVAESGATLRTSIGVAIGSQVQAYDADLADLADRNDVSNYTIGGTLTTGTLAATTVTGANVTTGADPGHTHSTYGLTAYWYISSSTYTGSTADTAPGANEHICIVGEWVGMPYDESRGVSSALDDECWIDYDTNTTTENIGDCSNWSTASGSSDGHRSQLSTSTIAEGFGDVFNIDDEPCSATLKVYICSDGG